MPNRVVLLIDSEETRARLAHEHSCDRRDADSWMDGRRRMFAAITPVNCRFRTRPQLAELLQ